MEKNILQNPKKLMFCLSKNKLSALKKYLALAIFVMVEKVYIEFSKSFSKDIPAHHDS